MAQNDLKDYVIGFLIKDGMIVDETKTVQDEGDRWLSEIQNFLFSLPRDFKDYRSFYFSKLKRVINTYPNMGRLCSMFSNVINTGKEHQVYATLKLIEKLPVGVYTDYKTLRSTYFKFDFLGMYIIHLVKKMKIERELKMEECIHVDGVSVLYFFQVLTYLKNVLHNSLTDQTRMLLRKKILMRIPSTEREVEIQNSIRKPLIIE